MSELTTEEENDYQLILDILRSGPEEGMTVTSISKELGYSKKSSRVARQLYELESNNIIAANTDGTYVKWFYCEEDTETLHDGFNPDIVNIPENLHGYLIHETSKGFDITLPSGSVHKITKSQRMLVINEERHVRCKYPEDVLGSIEEYCQHKGISQYILNDLSLGRSVTPSDINTNPIIIFVDIRRHNKAG